MQTRTLYIYIYIASICDDGNSFRNFNLWIVFIKVCVHTTPKRVQLRYPYMHYNILFWSRGHSVALCRRKCETKHDIGKLTKK